MDKWTVFMNCVQDIWLRYAFCNSWAYLVGIHGFYTSLSLLLNRAPCYRSTWHLIFWSNFTIKAERIGDMWNINPHLIQIHIIYVEILCFGWFGKMDVLWERSRCNFKCNHKIDISTLSLAKKMYRTVELNFCISVYWFIWKVHHIRSILQNKEKWLHLIYIAVNSDTYLLPSLENISNSREQNQGIDNLAH